MKKNILFIVSDMESGGFQKSLISLLKEFNYDEYNVDITILSPNGIFINDIPKEVKIKKLNIEPCFFYKFPQCLIQLIKEKKYY